MNGYVLCIAGAVLLSAVVSILLPKGKMGGAVKFASKLLCLFALIAPFQTLFRDNQLVLPETDTGYLATCERLAEEGEEGKIVLLISQDYGVNATVEVDCQESSPFAVKKVKIIVTDFGINAEEEHINIMSKIKTACEKEYGCEVSVL